MANFYGTARSNYFQVKDVEKFKAWVESIPSLALIEKQDILFAIYSDCPDSGCWPSGKYVAEYDEEGAVVSEDWQDFDLTGELAEHLKDGEVAVLMEAGAEKLRYISGWAVAVNHLGETVHVSLDGIYDLAFTKFGVRPTDASY